MKHQMTFVLLVSATLLGACGLLREKESPATRVELAQDGTDCTIPEASELLQASEARLNGVIDCVEARVRSAFKSVHGSTEGELTVDEIRQLNEKKIISVALEGDEEWNALKGALSMFHPEGRAAISRRKLDEIIAWARSNVNLFVRFRSYKDSRYDEPGIESFLRDMDEAIPAVERFMAFISPKGRMRLDQAQALAVAACRKAGKACESTPDTLREQVRGAWALRNAFLEDPEGQGAQGDLRGDSLSKLLKMSMDIVRTAPHTRGWIARQLRPSATPDDLAEEWKRASEIAYAYFKNHPFSAISEKSLRLLIDDLGSKALSDFAPDLVVISRKLAWKAARPAAGARVRAPINGLHPSGFAELVKQLEPIAKNLQEAAKPYGNCDHDRNSTSCRLSLRDILAQPGNILSRVALKGSLGYWYPESGSDTRVPRRLDRNLYWSTASTRVIQHGLLTKLFQAFDMDGDGVIPLTGEGEKTQEAFRLANTFLRFAMLENRSQKVAQPTAGEAIPEIEEPPAPLPIKAGPLYSVLGLVGDRWMPDGNEDGAMNADEFFSVVQVFQDVQENADLFRNTLLTEGYWPEPPQNEDYYWKEENSELFCRGPLIRKLHRLFEHNAPLTFKALASLEKEDDVSQVPDQRIRSSLFHSLISVPEKNRFVTAYKRTQAVYEYDPVGGRKLITPATYTPVEMNQYVRSDAALATSAIVSLMERMMIKCDIDENDRLDWKELDCAMPLFLEGGLQTVMSGMVDLDPIVHDGSQLVLKLLTQKGLPSTIAKLIAVNGSVRKFNLSSELQKKIETVSVADLPSLARFIGAPSTVKPESAAMKAWILDAKKRYGSCDTNADGILSGAEMDCFVERVFDETEKFAHEAFASDDQISGELVNEVLKRIRESAVVRLGIKAAAGRGAPLETLLSKDPEIGSDLAKLLTVLENAIRRSDPIWAQPDC